MLSSNMSSETGFKLSAGVIGSGELKCGAFTFSVGFFRYTFLGLPAEIDHPHPFVIPRRRAMRLPDVAP